MSQISILYTVQYGTCTAKVFEKPALWKIHGNGAFEKRASPVALEAYKLASDPRALGKKTVNA